MKVCIAISTLSSGGAERNACLLANYLAKENLVTLLTFQKFKKCFYNIDKDINMGHLKGCLNYFIKEFFEVDKIKMRFRPSHFPFTEPSAEVDIGYKIENGKIVIGEGDQWLEILGCGMVHPNVLKNVKVDPDKFQGYAFGIGIDRLAMLKYGINDLRAFFECDYRWLNHFGFDPLDVPTNYRGLSR